MAGVLFICFTGTKVQILTRADAAQDYGPADDTYLPDALRIIQLSSENSCIPESSTQPTAVMGVGGGASTIVGVEKVLLTLVEGGGLECSNSPDRESGSATMYTTPPSTLLPHSRGPSEATACTGLVAGASSPASGKAASAAGGAAGGHSAASREMDQNELVIEEADI